MVTAMKSELQILLMSSALGLAAVVPAQSGGGQEPGAVPPKVADQDAAPAAKPWIAKLGSESYRERLDAERKLRELGAAAVPALRDAAEHAEDSEVQWRARRLLRQIERGSAGGLVDRARAEQQEPEPSDRGAPGGLPRQRMDAMREQFDRLFEHFERDFGVDIPRARFFDDEFFRDLQEQLRQGGGTSQGMTVQIGPDGVRVEVQEKDKDGKVETKVYEAPDLDTFQKQYPDVLRQNGLGLGLSPFGRPFAGDLRGFVGPLQRGFDDDKNLLTPRIMPFGRQAQVPQAEPAVGRRLGVYVQEIPAGVREYLELPEGTGLMVGSVQADSLAAALGLQPNDIVLRIGDRTIGSPADVQTALGAIAKGDKVEVEYVRKGRHEHASATKTEAAEAAPANGKLEPRSGGTGGTIR